jgi:hypothetical protein
MFARRSPKTTAVLGDEPPLSGDLTHGQPAGAQGNCPRRLPRTRAQTPNPGWGCHTSRSMEPGMRSAFGDVDV